MLRHYGDLNVLMYDKDTQTITMIDEMWDCIVI